MSSSLFVSFFFEGGGGYVVMGNTKAPKSTAEVSLLIALIEKDRDDGKKISPITWHELPKGMGT